MSISNPIIFFCLASISLLQSKTLFAQNEVDNELDYLNHLSFDWRYDSIEYSLELNDSCLGLIKYSKDKKLIANTLSVRGVLLKNLEDFDNSIQYQLRALELRSFNRDTMGMSRSCTNIGNVFYLKGQLNRAKEYYQQSLRFKLDMKDSLGLAKSYNNLGNLYKDEGKIDSSKLAYSQGLTYASLYDHQTYGTILFNLGILYRETNQLQESESALHQALEIQVSEEDDFGEAMTLHNLGLNKEILHQHDSAKYYYLKTLSLAEELEFLELKRDVNLSMVHNCSFKGASDSLRFYLQTFTALNDSINKTRLEDKSERLETLYRVEKKNSAIKFEIEKNKRISTENNFNKSMIFILLGFIFILIIFVSFLLRFYQQKRKLTYIQLEQKKLEFERLLRGYEMDVFEARFFGENQERQRVAIDLHDRLGGLLAAIKIQLESIEPNERRQLSNKSAVDNISLMISEGITEVRAISHNLHSQSILDNGLKETIKSICKSVSSSQKINIDLYLESYPSDLDSNVEKEIYKIFMELLANSLRHSMALQITYQISQIKEYINIVFEDNGKGFDPKFQRQGLGMKNIDKRVHDLKGSWTIDSTLDHGSTFIINIPIS